jgi:hypothetical protein
LTRREQDLDNQAAAKIALRTQTLLQLENLDLRIIKELVIGQPGLEICLVETPGMDLIDVLLQANCTANSLQEYQEDAEQNKGYWTIDNGLLKHRDCLVVAKDDNLQT